MSNLVNLDEIFQRSRERVKSLGEVFTPEAYVDDMLSMLGKEKKGFWSDENVAFFEPSCGHGNIVIPIFRKRLEAIYKKANAQDEKNAPLYAVANALNTLWAIDIDSKNVTQCRARVLEMTLDFLKEKLGFENDFSVIKKNAEFMAHILCAINWQIHENETLSSLSKASSARTSANLTKLGGKWQSKNGHKELDFEFTWAVAFKQAEASGVVPLDFERACRFIKSVLSGNVRGFIEYDFAKFLIANAKSDSQSRARSKDLAVGI